MHDQTKTKSQNVPFPPEENKFITSSSLVFQSPGTKYGTWAF